MLNEKIKDDNLDGNAHSKNENKNLSFDHPINKPG
jgi:hypothetical protein